MKINNDLVQSWTCFRTWTDVILLTRYVMDGYHSIAHSHRQTRASTSACYLFKYLSTYISG
jgi:hypothetical protein